MFLHAGAKLDKYEVLAPLAVGGMAELYVARTTGVEGFERLCVLKRILPQYARDDEFVAMFLDEARLAATLHHPNVIQVYDIGQKDGLYYFAMEYVHGQDLAAIISAARRQKRGLKLEHSIAIAAEVAAGLHHAHEQRDPRGTPLGIVHRDVSPTNILVSYDGNVKVVDFGIAKAAARRTMTTAGSAKGKLGYMSPEQVRAHRDLDRRSDVFSLGIVLYELTTGKPLFRGDSDFAIAEQIVEGTIPSPRAVRPTYSPGLEAIVMKALARDRAARFATARELQLALEEYARTEQLRLSAVGISEFMAALFPDQVMAWDGARRAGRSLIDHVADDLVTRLAVSTSTPTAPADPRRWWRRPSTVIAGLGIAAAAAGWAVVLQQRAATPGPATSPVMAPSDAAPAAIVAAPPDAAPVADAAPAPAVVATPPDARDRGRSRRRDKATATVPPAGTPGSASDTLEPPPDRDPPADKGSGSGSGLDNTLNPF